jgi:hypothetical protein
MSRRLTIRRNLLWYSIREASDPLFNSEHEESADAATMDRNQPAGRGRIETSATGRWIKGRT